MTSIPSHEHAWFTELPAKRVLEMRGIDGLDLLQRISTNDLAKLAVGSWAQTVLTNEKGRMIDALWVGRIQNDLLYLLSGADPERSKTWIEKFIIMEDALISVSSETFREIVVVNAEIARDVPLMRFHEGWDGTGFLHLLVKEINRDAAIKHLAELNITERSIKEFEDCRISKGIPLAGFEITPEYNPLEAGLQQLISWTKGCYIGQEVIARLDTYKKVRRHLVRLTLADRISPLPARIISSAGEVGMLTSATSKFPFAGLGYLVTEQIEAGGPMFVAVGNNEVQVTVKN